MLGAAGRPARPDRAGSRSCSRTCAAGHHPRPAGRAPARARPARAATSVPDDRRLAADAARRRGRHADRPGASACCIGGLAGALGGWVDTAAHAVHRHAAGDAEPAARGLDRRAGRRAEPDHGDDRGRRSVSVPIFARLLRGSMLAQRHSRLRARGDRARRQAPARSCCGTCCPTRSAPVIVQATLTLATAIIEAAALSFLGLGDPDPAAPSGALMLADAQRYFDVAPGAGLLPGGRRSSSPRSASPCSVRRCARPSTRSWRK